ncbi:type II secretion system GspH family protein [Candidatus Parcubacteria bacterium]|nr:type II secretion system GspH family protein [Candidatus Parcubacteria bacterium]
MMKPVLNQRGQILIPIVLVMIISLSMGVAIAYRAASSTRQAVVLTEADQAYHCAEAGIEEALEILKSDPTLLPPGSGDFQDASDNIVCHFEYVVTLLGGGSGTLDVVLEKDEVFQVNLKDYSGSLEIYWGKGNQDGQDTALVVAVVKGSAGSYTMEKYAVNCGGTGLTGNEFNLPALGSGDYPCGLGTLNFSNDAQLLRIRALYNGTEVRVIPSDASFPSQGYKITSTGQAGESERIVVATRSNPALPAIFDYVLFSGSESQPLTK